MEIRITKQSLEIGLAVARMREEAEVLMDSIDLLEARARNLGKPTLSLAEAKKKLGLK